MGSCTATTGQRGAESSCSWEKKVKVERKQKIMHTN